MPAPQKEYIFWKDIDIQLRRNARGDVADQENKYAILNSVYNILSTVPGTRRWLPDFACDIKGLLFEPMDDETSRRITDQILGALARWEPRIKVTHGQVIPNYDQATYTVSIVFEILKSNEQINLDFSIRKL